MAKFKKKPTTVEAVQFDPHKQPWPDGIKSWQGAGYQPRDGSWGYVATLEGRKHVQVGDWIVRGVASGLDLVKDAAFRQTYEPADEEAAYLWKLHEGEGQLP